MEKHLEKFCKQNPTTTLKCPGCGEEYVVKTEDYLAVPNTFVSVCPRCKKSTEYDTTKLFESLEFLKRFH